MPGQLFNLPAPKTVTVKGEDAAYPVYRVFCVGRNYAAHAAEMGVEVDREAPFYFTKSARHVEASGQSFAYPPGTGNYHYEMELVVAIGKPAFQVTKAQAAEVVYGYACGLDMTRRDLQLAERAKQRPWDLGKDVEHSAIIAPITKAAELPAIENQRIRLQVNGETKQDATLDELIWKIDEIISHLSGFYHLQPGDLIMTGTPAGVGPVEAGDSVNGEIDGLDPVSLIIESAG